MNFEQIVNEINKDLDDTQDNGDLIGWINRCVDDLSPIAKKEAKNVYDITSLNTYELPVDMIELVVILVNGLEYHSVPLNNSYSTGYKIWGNILSLQNTPESGTIEIYYYKRLNHLENLADIPEIEPSFHDLFVLYTIANNQFMEDEPERQMDAISRYNNRKQEFQAFVMKNSFTLNAQKQITDAWG
ncbi:hypothetical protein V7139_09555 [Neobacillus drentensis]|uniref:phage adaptor protein n=1 Tax=Neobacillus drentensis TaxID=220684 RepID=UPI0030037F41